jgi:hypothetical protein
VAKQKIGAGTSITDDLVEKRTVPLADVGDDAVAVDLPLAGSVTKRTVSQGVCLEESDLRASRFTLALPVTALEISSETPSSGDAVHLILSPEDGQDDSDGVVIDDATVAAIDADEVSFSLPAEAEALIAMHIGRSSILVVDVPR